MTFFIIKQISRIEDKASVLVQQYINGDMNANEKNILNVITGEQSDVSGDEADSVD